jgi:hypothetical protein
VELQRLALRLIESLDPGKDEDVDELWLAEAERRLRQYDEGSTTEFAPTKSSSSQLATVGDGLDSGV